MKKNGFTLIELLAAIVVLGIISLVVFPTVDRTIKNQKRKLYDRQVSTIVDAAKGWGVKNVGILPEDSDKVYVGINALATSGMLENSDINDPRNDEKINGCVIIQFDTSHNQYTYEFINLETTTDSNCDVDKVCTVSDGNVTCN